MSQGLDRVCSTHYELLEDNMATLHCGTRQPFMRLQLLNIRTDKMPHSSQKE